MTGHTHHRLRNTAIFVTVTVAVVIYTVVVDTRNNFPNHPPLHYPKFFSDPHFVPAVPIDVTESGYGAYDHDRHEVERNRWLEEER